ncbi:MAG: hypothetical protein WC663_00250 [Patescibacteria group bacterium]|jgi:hypothetical protein
MAEKKAEKKPSRLFYFWKWIRHYADNSQIFFLTFTPAIVVCLWYESITNPRIALNAIRAVIFSAFTIVLVILFIVNYLKLKSSWQSYAYDMIDSQSLRNDTKQSS